MPIWRKFNCLTLWRIQLLWRTDRYAFGKRDVGAYHFVYDWIYWIMLIRLPHTKSETR